MPIGYSEDEEFDKLGPPKVSKDVQKWADVAMFKADEIDPEAGPQVHLLSCNNDPLGTIAVAALMYEGKSVKSLAEITDEQRRYYLEQTRKTALKAPLEFVNFHFIISGVTRGFTHQMVRQRTATYTQESTRFAVKEDVPVGRPPSLDGTVSWSEWVQKCQLDLYPNALTTGIDVGMVADYASNQASPAQLWRKEWDDCVGEIDLTYNALVSAGMPAEDARGLLPTNLLTRINYNTSLRGLLEHSGVRLCTQAQFEWRLVWAKMKEAIVEYGKSQYYAHDGIPASWDSAAWQFKGLSEIFKPICYQTGSCQFNADVDRACKIKSRVEAFADLGIPSAKWGNTTPTPNGGFDGRYIPPIKDEEWMMDPSAARVSQ
jgi:flavin-dependent thymidylate synthase